jgi:hypothetical protein
MEYTIHDFISESENQQSFYNDQISKLDNLLNDYKIKIDDLSKRKTTSLNTISKIALPEFTEDSLSILSKKINDKTFINLHNDFINEKTILEKRIKEIEQIDDYSHRDALTDPKSGVLSSQINELKPLYQRANETCQRILRFPAFRGLNLRKYGTNLYPYKGFMKYFIPQYYQDWKHSDEIVEDLKVNNFVDVLTLFNESEKQVNAFSASIHDYENQINNIKTLEKEYNDSVNKLNNLDEIYFIKIGAIIIEYIKNLHKTDLQPFLTSYGNLEDEYKKYDGIEHQIDYLKQIYEKVVGERGKLVDKAGKLNEESLRYKMDSNKYRNKRFSEDQFQNKFARDEARYDSLYDKYNNYGNTIYVYNDYYRASLLSDFLWWDLMTSGHMYGGFIPEVQQFHAENPQYEYDNSTSGADINDNS